MAAKMNHDPARPSLAVQYIGSLHPVYFALVMATGIVSIASSLFGMAWVAAGMFWLNLGLYIALWGLTIARVTLFRACKQFFERSPSELRAA